MSLCAFGCSSINVTSVDEFQKGDNIMSIVTIYSNTLQFSNVQNKILRIDEVYIFYFDQNNLPKRLERAKIKEVLIKEIDSWKTIQGIVLACFMTFVAVFLSSGGNLTG